MKFKYTLLVLSAAIGLQANAQTWVADSVDMTGGYAKDVFYDLKTGNSKSQTATDWDIAFQMTKFGDLQFNASVRANHIHNSVEVYSLHMKASSKFGNLASNDTMGLTNPAMQLVNNDTSWGEGAFTVNRNTSNLFDYGWGQYQGPPNHNLLGDSLYLVLVNGYAYQVWIKEYKSVGAAADIGYTFRIADFDGSNDVTDSIKRVSPYDDRLFAYYNLSTKAKVDREPSRTAWDIMFTQYQKDKTFGPTPGKLQAYTGVLHNTGVEVAEVTATNPNSITSSSFNTYLSGLSYYPNTIGDDWKTFNMSTFKYELDTNTSFIVKSKNAGEYYQLQFTRFDGSATGKVVFRKRMLGVVTSVSSVNDTKASYSVFPNPSSGKVNIMIDAEKNVGNATLTVTDMTGKVIRNSTLNINKGLNAYSSDISTYPAGTYIIMVSGNGLKISDKVLVRH